ncbi:MAG: EamA family transporter [Rhizobiales bacterium]|nr:EamA family transporter [Hyphomicrobiales bacterium]
MSSDPLLGAGLYTIAIALLAAMDALAKHLVATFDFAQIVFFRGAFALLPVLAFILATRRRFVLSTSSPAMQLARIATAAIATALFFISLKYLILAKAAAITLLAPVLMTISAGLLGMEKIGLRQAGLVALGLVGGLLIVSPWSLDWHDTSALGILLALGATVFYCAAMLMTRELAARGESDTMLLATPLGMSLLALPVALPAWDIGWQDEWLAFTGVGLLGGAATILIIQACRFASIGVLAPFDYSIFLFSAAIGYLVWSERPEDHTWLGVAVIAFAMVLVRKRRQPLAVSPEGGDLQSPLPADPPRR